MGEKKRGKGRERRETKKHWVYVENLREKLKGNFPGRKQVENKLVTLVSKSSIFSSLAISPSD